MINQKKAKELRRLARQIASKQAIDTRSEVVNRHLVVHPAHEEVAKSQGFAHVTAVNAPGSVRGIGRKLKRLAE